MVSSYLEPIKNCRDEIYTLQRKARTKADESNDFLDESEILYLDLIRLVNEAVEGELEPNEAQEIKTIWEEVKASRETVRQNIVEIFANH